MKGEWFSAPPELNKEIWPGGRGGMELWAPCDGSKRGGGRTENSHQAAGWG